MKALARVTAPNDVEVSITFTMPLAQWKKLREQMNTADHPTRNPMWELTRKIQETVSGISAYVEVDETEEVAA